MCDSSDSVAGRASSTGKVDEDRNKRLREMLETQNQILGRLRSQKEFLSAQNMELLEILDAYKEKLYDDCKAIKKLKSDVSEVQNSIKEIGIILSSNNRLNKVESK